jgi:hypothetical protein
MKRILVLIAIALIAGGAVWAQDTFDDERPSKVAKEFDPFGHDFSAVGTSSTEARYSAGRYDSDVDTFIDVNDHNPAIGTFFFLGGYPADGDANVDDTNHLTSTRDDFPYEISFGIGKTLSFGYLGIYYAGSFVEASGSRLTKDPVTKNSTARWNNNLAILLGIANMGFRFDLTEAMEEDNTTDISVTSGKKTETKRFTHGPGIALSWGLKTDNLLPGLQIGFKFPDTDVTTNDAGKTGTEAEGGIFSLKGWTWIALTETGSMWTSVQFAALLPNAISGDKDVTGVDPYTVGGSWGLDFYIHYQQEVDLGKLGLKVKPKLGLNFVSVSHNSTMKDSKKQHSDDYLDLSVGLDVGLKYQHNEKFAFYTGASLDFFDWSIVSHAGGDKDYTDDTNAWDFTGIKWTGSQFTGKPGLGLGMTFTPAPGIVIGTGLNTFLDKILVIDLEKMQIKSGDFWDGNQNNIGSWFGSLFQGLEFDLTVSVKF